MKKKYSSILLTLITLIIITIPFWVFNLDIKIQELLYSDGWKYGSAAPVLWLYKYGTVPGMLLGGLAIVVLGLSFMNTKFLAHRKAALIVIITFLLGPALLVNIVFKSYGGRPRPREVTEFNGPWEFRHACQLGTAGKGHSFPCGHSSAGFVIAALFLAYRKKYKKTAYAFLITGGLYGTVLGAGRMMQGAHFASDVIWSAGMVWIAALFASNYIVKPDEDRDILMYSGKYGKTIGITSTSILLVSLVLIFLFSTPFYKEKSHNTGDVQKARISIFAEDSNVKIISDSKIKKIFVRMNANGFGMKGNDYIDEFIFKDKDGVMEAKYSAVKKGIFTELISKIEVVVPESIEAEITVNLKKGSINYTGSGKYDPIILYSGDGDIEFNPEKNAVIGNVFIKNRKGDIAFIIDKDIKIENGISLEISSLGGRVILENESEFFKGITDEMSGSKELMLKGTGDNRRDFKISAGKRLEVISGGEK